MTKRIGNRTNHPTPARDYFHAHLHDVTDGCMLWPYATTSAGYGQVSIGGRDQHVHVLACTAWHGPRPPGMDAAHGPCHNRRCWNGSHMSWKTPAQNKADELRDGTRAIGSRHGLAKLTDADVLAIRSAYAAGGVTQTVLGREYSVATSTVSAVVNRSTWTHV